MTKRLVTVLTNDDVFRGYGKGTLGYNGLMILPT